MPPVNHPVSGTALVFTLAEELQTVRAALARAGARTARTLVKEGALRATLVGLAPGGELKEHRADGPITVHVLEGEVTFTAEGIDRVLAAGSLLSLAPGITHAVKSAQGGIFLLTVAAALPPVLTQITSDRA